MTPTLLLLLTLATLQPQAGALTAEERALTAFIDADNDRALALLEKAVNINSGTMNFAGVRAVGAALRPEFDALGFKTEWVDGASFERAGHLVADHPGRGRASCSSATSTPCSSRTVPSRSSNASSRMRRRARASPT